MAHESITVEISSRICNHMNKDHKDAVIAFARHYAGIKTPINAKMTEIKGEAMYLEVDGKNISIPFDHKLKDAHDAHQTLIALLKEIPK